MSSLGASSKTLLGNIVGDDDDYSIVALLTSFLEFCEDIFYAKDLEFLFGLFVFLDLLEQLLQVAHLVRIRYVPAVTNLAS